MKPKRTNSIRPPRLGAGFVSGEDDIGEFHEVMKMPPGGSVVETGVKPPTKKTTTDQPPADPSSPPDGRLPGS